VGSVIPTRGAIIPAAVGVDIGCGMIARRTTLTADHLPDGLGKLRSLLEEAVPAGRADHTSRKHGIPDEVGNTWRDELEPGWRSIIDKHKKARSRRDGRAARHARRRQPLRRDLPRPRPSACG
jgi:tRNA-splicing ligase RtcB